MKSAKLNRKLFNYSLLSISFLAVQQEAAGQGVYYTDLVPDVQLDGGLPAGYDELGVDVNDDGIDDFRLSATKYSNIWSSHGYWRIAITPFGANEVAQSTSFNSCFTSASGTSTGYRDVALAMSLGEVVSSGLNWVNAQADLQFRTWCSCYYWCPFSFSQYNGGTKYIPISFDDSGNSHFGWIRVEKTSATKLTVFEHALSAVPDMPLPIVGYSSCAAPTGLNTVLTSPINATLSWSAVTMADKYLLTGSRVGFPTVISKTVPTNSKSVGGITSGATYEWQVRTQCLDGSISPVSLTTSFTVPGPLSYEEAAELDGSQRQQSASLVVMHNDKSSVRAEVTLEQSGAAEMSIMDLSGVVLERRNFDFDSGENFLDIHHNLKPGFYLLTINVAGLRQTVSLVIPR